MSHGILITGGAGYVGSHVIHALKAAGYQHLVALDNLSTGFAESIPDTRLIIGDVQDAYFIDNLIKQEKIDTVLHFAALTVISESIQQPLRYYQNNTVGTLNLLNACHANKIRHFVFSSTAAIYGPSDSPIPETHACSPLSPYGYSKLMSEQIITDATHAYDFNAIILRYFNVAGASMNGELGQRTLNATHLIKRAVQSALDSEISMPIYGTDYQTPDGTCVRDFIHIEDLANAHVKALQYLHEGGKSLTLNCGYGHGYSVKEVIDTVEKVAQRKLPIIISSKRSGDLPIVVADNSKIRTVLDWQPKFDDLDKIVRSAFEFEKRL